MLIRFAAPFLLCVLLGFLSGLGTGGGSLLMLWLVLIQNADPITAKQINLLFFLASASIASYLRLRQLSVSFRSIYPAIAGGVLSAAAFSFFSQSWNISFTRKLFGILLIYMGYKQITNQNRTD